MMDEAQVRENTARRVARDPVKFLVTVRFVQVPEIVAELALE